MLTIDLRGKRALVAGVADDGGFGFAIAKALAEAGATVVVGTWPPALGIFKTLLERGKIDASLPDADGRKLEFEKIYPLDAEYDTLEDAPAELREPSAIATSGDFTIDGLAAQLTRRLRRRARHRRALARERPRGEEAAARDLAQGLPRRGRRRRTRWCRWSSTSGRSCAPAARSCRSSYMARERVVPGYGGGMSSAKAALESTRACSRSRPAASGATAST